LSRTEDARTVFCYAAQQEDERAGPGIMAMAIDRHSWKDQSWRVRAMRLGRSHLATQAAVLLPVIAIAGLSAWTLVSGASRASGQSVPVPALLFLAAQDAPPADPTAETKTQATTAADPIEAAPAPAPGAAVPPAEAPPVNGLKIASQSWRRGGLGSNALVTFTLRNNNDYAVKDIEIACVFARRDGSHLTDRTRVVPGTVEMKSRKTFARLHVGFVNVNANKAKCALVAANRI
jgi:hypothetical protein